RVSNAELLVRPTGTTKLIVKGVSHSFGDLQVLSDINFTVESGEILAVIGPSGCGKSTLLGMIGGLLKPCAGEILISGSRPADSLNPLTYVFQDFALLPWRTVEANVALALDVHPLSKSEKKARVED